MKLKVRWAGPIALSEALKEIADINPKVLVKAPEDLKLLMELGEAGYYFVPDKLTGLDISLLRVLAENYNLVYEGDAYIAPVKWEEIESDSEGKSIGECAHLPNGAASPIVEDLVELCLSHKVVMKLFEVEACN